MDKRHPYGPFLNPMEMSSWYSSPKYVKCYENLGEAVSGPGATKCSAAEHRIPVLQGELDIKLPLRCT